MSTVLKYVLTDTYFAYVGVFLNLTVSYVGANVGRLVGSFVTPFLVGLVVVGYFEGAATGELVGAEELG